MKFFAMVRERLGKSEIGIELQPGSTIADVRTSVELLDPEIKPLLDRSMIMRNQEYTSDDDIVEEGDEIAFIPPVSGGDHVRVHADPLDAAELERRVHDPGAGAIVTFTGTVRDNARGKPVTSLDYEAYPEAAELQLRHICDEMREQWPVLGIAIEHRTGMLSIGEASVIITVSSAHREAAFEAASYAIRRIKQIVPIWKKEFYADGESWIGSEHDYQVETGRISGS
ncbi:MAG: molybdenum cofactor biosynthesis protein [Chloroflexota bacterium]